MKSPCISCDAPMEAGEHLCAGCGAPALTRARNGSRAVVGDPVIAMAPRGEAAALIARWSGRDDVETIAGALKKGALVVDEVTATTAQRVVERLRRVGLQAREVDSKSQTISLPRRLFGPLPLLAYAAGGVVAVLLHPLALAGGVAAGLVLAVTRRSRPVPLVVPPLAPPTPPTWSELEQSRSSLDGEARAAVDEILRGSLDLLARVDREGFTVDPEAEHGVGRAVARVVEEGLSSVERARAGAPEATDQLKRLAQAMREAGARLPAGSDELAAPVPEVEAAEHQLLREVDVVREICAATALPPEPEQH